jgi:eukaryotic-like serine/threonine-protein kinase
MNLCGGCGATLVASEWGELCVACALTLALPPEGQPFGDYERFERLGEGAMGEVFIAKHRGSDDVVALKLAKPELLELAHGATWFRQQAKLESKLKHPNIVPVQGVGEHRGRPFLVMQLMEGGTLAEPENLARFASTEACLGLGLKLARAVQFAHERGILHCDLKPENILFDALGEPKVGDFGLARELGASGASELGGVHGGTPGWMSPEQLKDEPLTTASDVFALGLLLHWLVTRELAFSEGAELKARVVEAAAPPLRPWTPERGWTLEAIAHRAMQEEPAQRYASAAALAEDLERVLDNRAPQGAVTPLWGRAWYWTQRHPGVRTTGFVLLALFAALLWFLGDRQQAELRRATLDTNAYAASGQAAAVLYQFREYADAVQSASADPAVQALTHGPRRVPSADADAAPIDERCRSQQALEDAAPLVPYAQKFTTLFVLDAVGCPRARLPDEPILPNYVQEQFDFRDYFAGAEPSRDGVLQRGYVRKAYRSSISKRIKFAVSTPLYENGAWVGVLTGSMVAAATLELPRMKRRDTRDQMTVLLGPFEGERPGERGVALHQRDHAEYTFLAHPGLKVGQKVTFSRALATELARAFGSRPGVSQFELGTELPLQHEGYVDPLLGGTWLAAMAPVGGTGYVVLVQSRDSVAIRPSSVISRLAVTLAVASAALLLLYAGFWWWSRRRLHLRS